MALEAIDFIKVPRLEWDDRKIEYTVKDQEQSLLITNKHVNMPNRLLIAGRYSCKIESLPFVGLVSSKQ